MSQIFTAEDARDNASNHSNTSTNDNNLESAPSANHKKNPSKTVIINGTSSQTGADQTEVLQDNQKPKVIAENDHVESSEAFKVLSEKKFSKKSKYLSLCCGFLSNK